MTNWLQFADKLTQRVKEFALFGGFLVLVGVFCFIGAYAAYWNTKLFLVGKLKTTGIVVDLENGSDAESFFHPIVEFIGPRGEAVRFRSSFGSTPPMYSRGEIVKVLFDPLNPSKAKINDFPSLWGSVAVTCVVGIGFFSAGILVIRQ